MDKETIHLVDNLIIKERPDFVAITGDIVSGQGWDREYLNFWETHYNLIANELTRHKIPFGIVPGYHDFEADLTQHDMLEVEGKHMYAASMPNYYDYFGESLFN